MNACNNKLWRGYNSLDTGQHSCTPEQDKKYAEPLKMLWSISERLKDTDTPAQKERDREEIWGDREEREMLVSYV